jgi:hypothetical protein
MDMQFGELKVGGMHYDSLTDQLEATHLGANEVASSIAALLLADFLISRRVAAKTKVRAPALSHVHSLDWGLCE